jgi:protein-disulfide isomerase/uncharacterized membrane protein
MIGKVRVLLVILFMLVGAGLSGLLLMQHHGEDQAVALTSQICGDAPAEETGCGKVNQSQYSMVAGVPLAAAGVFFYLSLAVLLVLAVLAGPEVRGIGAGLALMLLGLGLAADLVLLGLQALKIGAFCRLCLYTYLLTAASFVLLWPARRRPDGAFAAAAGPQGRLVIGGWVLGSLFLVAALAGAELTLEHRARSRSVSLLGGPVSLPPLPSPASGPAGTGGAELARARAEAQQARQEAARLREILESPEKVQEYYASKAMDEYEGQKVEKLDLTGVPVLGSAAAPVRVVEFSDFLCPHCKQLAAAFESYLPQSGGRVGVYFKNYPLDQECNPNLGRNVNPGSCWLARGAICASQLGGFKPYYDKVWEASPRNATAASVADLAAGVGLDRAAMEACLGSSQADTQLKAEIAEAARLGVTGTPTLFVNGRRLQNLGLFLQAVDKESQRLGLAPLPPPQAGHAGHDHDDHTGHDHGAEPHPAPPQPAPPQPAPPQPAPPEAAAPDRSGDSAAQHPEASAASQAADAGQPEAGETAEVPAATAAPQ